MIKLEDIRLRLVEAIKNSGISQVELANKLGLKQPTISRYLVGGIMPALDTLANICKILDLDANYILCIN